MNNRVVSAGCSIAPQSSSGMVHLTVSSVKSALSAATSIMAGFKFHKMRVASVWPSGIKQTLHDLAVDRILTIEEARQ